MEDQNTSQNPADITGVSDNNQSSSSNSGDDAENDAKALLEIADTLDEQADQIEQVVAETSQEYEKAVKEDVIQMDEAVEELGVISHEADLDDAKQRIDEA